MDKIKTVKIKNEDGSISEESYTISVDARNVDMDNGKELQETIGTIDIDTDGSIAEQLENLNDNVNDLNIDIKKKAYFFDTVADMKNANLKVGDYACTLGYYEPNDGGAAQYKIKTTSNNYYEILNNGLKAELVIDNNTINVKQLGVYGDNIHDDTQIIQNAINLSINKYKVYIPDGNYKITQTLKTYANNIIEMSENTYLNINNIDGLYVDGNSTIKGGNIVTSENYSHVAITMLPTSVTKFDEKIGGLFNLSIKNKTPYSIGSIAISFDFIDNNNVSFDGITYQSFQNIDILNFDYGIKAVSNESDKWITSLNFDNIKMTFCKNFIYSNMIKDFTGNKFTNMHLQIDKNNLDYIIYLGGKAEDNYFNIIEWDIDIHLNENTIYLSNLTKNNKIEADRLFNYSTLKLINDNGKNNYITSAFIENTYLERTNLKEIDLTGLDNTKAYPILFENMCNIKLWKYSQTGAIYSYLYLYLDAVSSKGTTIMPNYFVRLSTHVSEQLIPKIEANANTRYIAVYLKGGYKYNFLDYNYQYQELSYKEYYYIEQYSKPYIIVTDSFTTGGVTYTPISNANSIPRGMYYDAYANVNLDKDSTPLTLT